jgi:hypothetical protein
MCWSLLLHNLDRNATQTHTHTYINIYILAQPPARSNISTKTKSLTFCLHEYLTGRSEYNGVPLKSNFRVATKLLQTFFAIPALQQVTTTTTATATTTDDNTPAVSHALYDFLIDLQSNWKCRTLHALPATHAEAVTVIHTGGGLGGADIAVIHQPNATRSMEWL